jgi:peptidoglycan/xylan/chitin deacetylase (PgdA/CDA1 family)
MTMFMRYPGGLAKALTFSYDDAVEEDRELIRILDEYGMKATFNISSGLYAPEDHVWPEGAFHRRMTRKQCIELYKDSGHEIAIHCLTHKSLVELPQAMMVQEVTADRINLEKEYGGIIRGAQAVKKSFPHFFSALYALGADVTLLKIETDGNIN